MDATLQRVAVLGTRVTVATFGQARDAVASLVERGGPGYVSCANAYSLSLALDDADYRGILDGASIVTADGMSVVWALDALGHRCERVHNDDLYLELCARHPGWRHFLVGGRRGQPEAVAAEMSRRVPGIRIVGTCSTPERPVPPDETAAILEAIRGAQAQIVWVGMGTPAQDIWMHEAAPVAGLPMVGVGSVFDLVSGRTRAAPDWMKRSGLQWLFRLRQEPARLGRRYLYHNWRFAAAFARQYVRQATRG